MMRIRKLLNFIALPLICGTVWASPIIVPVANANFGAPSACEGGLGYAYQGIDPLGCSALVPGGQAVFPQQDFNTDLAGSAVWKFTDGSGLTGPSTLFNPPSFDTTLPFTHAAFLQSVSSVSQVITGPAGMWTLSFYLGSRYNGSTDGKQTVVVKVDNGVVKTYDTLLSSTPFTLETVSFEASAGQHNLQFLGTATTDSTAFISGVSVSASSVPEPASFVLIGAGLVGLGLLRRNQRRV